MQPFRFGLQVSNAPDGQSWRELARKTEDLGYSTLYMPDHFTDQWGPLVGLTVAAEATTRLRVGTLVLGNDYRHPVVVAKEIATLDLVSDGRVEFGIGAGWMRSDYEQAGLAYDEPRVRVDRFEEAIAVYNQLLRDGTATFDGAHYQVAEAQGLPRPASPAGPQLVIGGGGKRVLSIAAREADVVGINQNLRSGAPDLEAAKSSVPERYDERVAWIREAARGRFDDLELQILTFVVRVGGDRREMARRMAETMGITEDEAYDAPVGIVGDVDEICDLLHERRERWGVNYWVVHQREFEDFAPVVERLTGS
jgi:probable F420-dependent oxidoreductase